MKTRKKSKDVLTLRKLLAWRFPKRTQKYFHRKYIGSYLNYKNEYAPLYEIYSREIIPEKINIGCCSKKVVPDTFPILKKKQTYVWRISGGLFPLYKSYENNWNGSRGPCLKKKIDYPFIFLTTFFKNVKNIFHKKNRHPPSLKKRKYWKLTLHFIMVTKTIQYWKKQYILYGLVYAYYCFFQYCIVFFNINGYKWI
jgi:hypothetical protein